MITSLIKTQYVASLQHSGTSKNSRTTTQKANFLEESSRTATEKLQGNHDMSVSRVEEYKKYMESKYGRVTIQSVGKDQTSLAWAGKSMSESDVIIAPNILVEMSNSSAKAAYYEQKIDYFFDTIIPRETASFAAKGLVFEPCGVVVHEDGTVTYISGCSDSPERVAEVNAINKAKREKEAAQRKELLERSQEAAEKQRQLIDSYNQKQAMAEALDNRKLDTENIADTNLSNLMLSAVVSYENTVNMYSVSMVENSKIL